MIRVDGFEQFGCPFVIVFLANNIKECKTLFYKEYPTADPELFGKVVDKHGYQDVGYLVEVSIG